MFALTAASTGASAALLPIGSDNATSVHLADMLPRGAVAPAGRSGADPSAPRSDGNATTVPLQQTLRNNKRRVAPRIGISPSAPDHEHDAASVN